MGENEQAEAMALLREQVPHFSQELFLEHIRDGMAPDVIGAYLKARGAHALAAAMGVAACPLRTQLPALLLPSRQGDVDVLKKNCREQALAQLQALVNEREQRNLLMDPRILHMSEVELEVRASRPLPSPGRPNPSPATHRPTRTFPHQGIRISGGAPTPVVSFETHQLHCIRSRVTASIVEGDEDDIRSVHYLWALQQREGLTDETPEAERWQVTELAVRGMMSTY
jgi:hypothetical protein